MMYLGDPPELKEHFFTESRSKCLELKEIIGEAQKIGEDSIQELTSEEIS